MDANELNLQSDDIEGLGDPLGCWGGLPIDNLLIRNEPRTIREILQCIAEGEYIMDPDFQRAFVWSTERQSKLIESILMRIPLPVFYLAEDEDGRMIVVDGLQRLTTLRRFTTNNLTLKLPAQPALDQRTFGDLEQKLRRRIENSTLGLYVIDAKVPERARLDVFERVNSGVPLTRQQMRNCLYSGPATRFLKEESASDVFIKATAGTVNVKTMRDRELVNRFCAFHILPLDSYKGDMDDFLATALKSMNNYTQSELDDLSKDFRQSLTNNMKVFGPQAFRKHTAGQTSRKAINSCLWDLMTTFFPNVPTSKAVEKSAALRQAFYSLLSDPEFVDALAFGPTSIKNVNLRFRKARRIFNEALGGDRTSPMPRSKSA